MSYRKVTPRTTKGLAEAMFEELDMLRNAESSSRQARAKAELAKAIMMTKRIEVDMACLADQVIANGTTKPVDLC